MTVEEGPEFKLGEVSLAGNFAPKSAELLKVAKFTPGTVANFDDVMQGVDRIRKRLNRQGYMHAETTIERALNDKTKTVNVTIRIDEGPQFNFGKPDHRRPRSQWRGRDEETMGSEGR